MLFTALFFVSRMAICDRRGLSTIMARNVVGLESALFEDLAVCETQRPKSWIHFPARSVGRVALMHELPLPFRTHWNGVRDVFCEGRENGCALCARGRGFKGHYAFAVYDLTRRMHGGFDFTDKACRQLLEVEHGAECRTGLTITIRKEGGIENGRFIVESSGLFVKPFDFGEPCSIVDLVVQTYGVDKSQLNPDFVAGLGYSKGIPAPLVEGALKLTQR